MEKFLELSKLPEYECWKSHLFIQRPHQNAFVLVYLLGFSISYLHQILFIMCNSPIEFFSLFIFEDQREEKVQKKNKQTPIHPHVKIKKVFNFQLHVKQKYYVKKSLTPTDPNFSSSFYF